MKDFFRAIFNRLQLPSVIFYLNLLSIKNYFFWLFSKTKFLKNSEFSGSKIALIALFKKGMLRNDIQNLIKTLREKNFYVIGVNTLKLSESHKNFFDCYIERYNFGRDFGSYKKGFQHIFSMLDKSERSSSVLMLNDSVFYSYSNLSNFIDAMSSENYEVIGATENFEIEHHLGSFCINFSKEIVENPKFQKYWNSYSLSDMRPKVIKKGEMGLSKIIKKCLSSSEKMNVLYSVESFQKFIDSNDYIWKNFNNYSRKSRKEGWPTPTINSIHKEVMHYILSKSSFYSDNIDLEAELNELNPNGVYTLDEYFKFLEDNNVTLNHNIIRELSTSQLLSSFARGSQIHQNHGFNYMMGCGILKLDAVYRGMINYQDILLMQKYMSSEDFKEYSRILLKTAFGEDTLFGWRRVAFLSGYI